MLSSATSHLMWQLKLKILRLRFKVTLCTWTTTNWNSRGIWLTSQTKTGKTGKGTKQRVQDKSSFTTMSRFQVCWGFWCTVFNTKVVNTQCPSIVPIPNTSSISSKDKTTGNLHANQDHLSLFLSDSRCQCLWSNRTPNNFSLLLRVTLSQMTSMLRRCQSTQQCKRSTPATSRQSALASLSRWLKWWVHR